MIKKIYSKNKDKIKISLLCLFIFLAILIIGLPFVAGLAYFTIFSGKVYPRIYVCGSNLTGQTKKEVQQTLYTFIETNFPSKITLVSGKEKFTLSLSSFNFLPKSTIEKVFNLGREKFPLLNIGTFVNLFQKGRELSLDYQIDNIELSNQIATISGKLFVPSVNPQIKYLKSNGQKSIVIESGKNGSEVDTGLLKKNLFKELSCPKEEISLEIPIIISSPQISKEAVESTKERAERLLNKEITLKLEDQNWKVNDEEIISLISFDGGYNKEKLSDYIKNFAKSVNILPENAAFNFENNRVVVFKASKEGISIKENELTALLLEKLIQLENGSQKTDLEIPVIKTSADISTENVNNLGIKEIIGKGTSLFYGSIAERIHNLNLASLKLNGILVAPNEEFSFNKSLGDVSADTGFKQAYIIKEGRTVLGDGGGVCQVSTTLFRAALNAGLPITERHAHAYRVHYYEDDLGPGFDATVFDPSADLKFKNDTGNYVLIQSSINLKKKQLTFELYGTNDDRIAEISKARVWDKIPPPPDVYQDDPTLPPGKIKQVDWKAWGSKTAFDYKVIRNGETIFQKTFTSVYHPWQAIYLRGTRK